ncbi:MAG: GGDEF domain-containing protein [Erysipelotrichaceae bacterium]
MFYIQKFKTNTEELDRLLTQAGIPGYLETCRENEPLHMSYLTKVLHQVKDDRIYELAYFTIGQILLSRNHYAQANSVFQECLELKAYKEPNKRILIYFFLLANAMKQENYYFVDFYMYQINRYRKLCTNEDMSELMMDYLTFEAMNVSRSELDLESFKAMSKRLLNMGEMDDDEKMCAQEISIYLHYHLGIRYELAKEYDDALQAFAQSRLHAMDLKKIHFIANCNLCMSRVYEQLKNKKMSLDLYKRYHYFKQMEMQTTFYDVSEIIMNERGIPTLASSILEVRRDSAHLDNMVHFDYLTGVPNYVYFNIELEKMIALENEEIGMLVIDIDDFKHYNDEYGHLKGDQALVDFGETLRLKIPPKGKIFRINSDRFTVIVSDMTKEDTVILGKQMLAAVRKVDIEHRILPKKKIMSVSIGVAMGGSTNVHQVFEHALHALESAKNNGKNRVAFSKGGTKVCVN